MARVPVLITPAADLPVALDTAKRHLRIAGDEDDSLVVEKLEEAVSIAETYLDRQLMPATYKWSIDSFYTEAVRFTEIPLPLPPLVSVDKIEYVDQDGVLQAVPASTYDVDTACEPGVIRLAYNQVWPVPRAQVNAVQITFIAGYADQEAIPKSIRSGILLMLGSLWENREDEITGTIATRMSNGFRNLLMPYRNLIA